MRSAEDGFCPLCDVTLDLRRWEGNMSGRELPDFEPSTGHLHNCMNTRDPGSDPDCECAGHLYVIAQDAEILAARVASAAAENAALRARLEALAVEFERDNEHSCFKVWCPDCRAVKLRRRLAAQFRAVLAAAHDEGSEQR